MRNLNEFSRPFEITQALKEPVPFKIEADRRERAAVARRLDFLEVQALCAEGRVETAGRQVLRVRGRLTARILQRCVVTLEPVCSSVETAFERLFRRGGADAALVEVSVEDPDLEPLVGDVLDLGEIVTEELALAADPYPRAPHADEALQKFGVVPEEEPLSPLRLALERLRDER